VKAKEQSWDSTGKSKPHPPDAKQWHPYTLASEMFTIMQQTTMSLRFLYFHLVVSMASKQSVVLDLIVKVKVNGFIDYLHT
jgi:hypothetical protein